MLRPSVAFALLLPFAAGCALLGNAAMGKSITAYEPAGSAQVFPAPKAATYALWQNASGDEVRKSGPEEIRLQAQIEKGKPVGFEKGPGGDLLAVAGERKFALPEGSYWWRSVSSSGSFHEMIVRPIAEGPEKVGEHLEFLWIILYPIAFAGYFIAPRGSSAS